MKKIYNLTRYILFIHLLFTTFAQAQEHETRDWTDRILYMTLIDRFQNGNPGNDNAHGDPECNNPNDPHAYQGGDLSGLKQRLPYIQKLGADAVWLTPLYKGVPQKQGRNCGFPGYWADFRTPAELEIDPRFGSVQELESLLDEGRQGGIAFMLDMVVNHAGYGAELVRQEPTWFHPIQGCENWGLPEITCPLAGLPDFNHQQRGAADYLADIHKMWLERFGFQGIRMDTVKHVEPDYFRRWISEMRSAKPGVFVIGELLEQGSFEPFLNYLKAGFDGLFNFPLQASLIETFAKGRSVDKTAERMQETINLLGQEQTRKMVNLLDNHDVPRFVEEFPPWFSDEDTQSRYLLALGAILSLPGIPQIYYGNEVGMSGGKDPDNRRMMPEWAFDGFFEIENREGYLKRPGEIYQTLQRLITLRKENLALRQGNYSELWRQNGEQNPNVWAFVRSLSQDNPSARNENLLIVFNNGIKSIQTPLNVNARGHFSDNARLTRLLHIAQRKRAPSESSEPSARSQIVVSGGMLKLAPEPLSFSVYKVEP